MKSLQTNNIIYKILVDGEFFDTNEFTKSDFEFFTRNSKESLEKNQLPLVEFKDSKVKVKFVGELITPETNYLSLPKKFTISENNSNLILQVLKKYKDLKKDGVNLLSNFSFSFSKEGIETETFFFNKLKTYFLDYITYEFIYPKKKLIKHSTRPLSNAKIDVVKTHMISKRKPGITYKVSDIKNTDDWNLDDIYYTTLVNLLDKVGNEKDRGKIENMKNYLHEQGYEFKKIDINKDLVIEDIKSCEVDIKHYPIINTLISYYEDQKVSNRFSVRAFYTKNFEYVWEYFSRLVFQDNQQFRDEIKVQKLINIDKEDSIQEFDDVRPDVFSEYKDRRFIGDCKYYRELDTDFYKEMYEYNVALGNTYPMVIFAPSVKTERYAVRRRSNYELFVLKISLEEVIHDVINQTNICIEKVHNYLSKSNRWDKDLAEFK